MKALIKIVKMLKEMSETLNVIAESTDLLIKIQSENMKKDKS